ncbi:MAG: DUF1624 domain-containing protein [Lachnospiraceae bacterium]|nr:DUF1624 domain-containing protein [Lachnospiraceae bacterium]
MDKKNRNKKRYEKLDGIRGIALLNMVAYHMIWDLVYIYQADWDWYRSQGAYIWQQGICWTFIFLSGFCWSLGSHALKRGITVFLGGAVITAATLAVMPLNRVVFGVLTLTGSCMLLMCLFDRWFKKLPASVGLAVSAVAFLMTRNVNEGALGFEKWKLCRLPSGLYKNIVTAFLGFPQEGFYSTDYFSLIPWMFLFTAGYFLFRFVNGKRVMALLENSALRPVEWLGKHSFGIYMVHQPVIYAVLEILFWMRS